VEQLNWTYSYGGPACLWKTLEQVSHIHIDHFIEVNFLSFRKIVDDVGGVPVCLPYARRSSASGTSGRARTCSGSTASKSSWPRWRRRSSCQAR
jgi:LCP family protein required for cell wall assembly